MIRLLSNALPRGSLTSRPPLAHLAPHPGAHRLALLARQALIAEAELTPKPGLVDRRGNGAHTDLSLDLMRRSALAIEPYFYRMAVVSEGTAPSQSVREQLAFIGRQAERAMLEATGGSNAHKGAIWSLGLLISAAAMHDEGTRTSAANLAVAAPAAAPSPAGPAACAAVAATAKHIASFQDRAMPRSVSHGDAVAKRYGVAGARGEALSGFPRVIEVALPILRRKREDGAPEQVARLDALIGIMSRLDDTCVLHRGGEAALTATKEGALAVEAAGGTGTPLGRHRLLELDRRLLALNASPGGSADLLAAALFLDALEQRQHDVAADRSLAEAHDGTH